MSEILIGAGRVDGPMDEGVTIERRSPETVFGLLGNELRVDILRALAETPDDARTFSDLREAVGERDSGKFNYHLGKLTGHFVKRSEEGYELSLAGRQVVGALLAGTYTADAHLDPIAIEDPCPNCGERALIVEYADERVHLRCTDCEQFRNEFSFPPGSLDQYDVDELPLAVDRWMWITFAQIVAGFCPVCGGRMQGELVLDDSEAAPVPGRAEYVCARCGDTGSASPRLPAAFHPAVIGFYWDHGVDLLSEPTWRTLGADDEIAVAVASRDPPSLTVTMTLEDDRVSVTIDETVRIVDVTRERV